MLVALRTSAEGGRKTRIMTVGKLKEYLNDIDNNVEIKGLRLYCKNGFSIQSKTLYMDNSQRLAELDSVMKDFEAKLKSEEVQNDYWYHVISNKSYLFRSILTEHIAELKGEENEYELL